MQAATIVRCCERLVIVITAAFLSYLGYRLYALGVVAGAVEFSWVDFFVKGTGPGLAFMLAGVGLLVYCLRTPIRVVERHESNEGGTEDVFEMQGQVRPPSS
jgi:hypothetical protein